MAAAATQASWIARQWKRGWEKIPLLMVCHCVSAPAIVFILIPNVFFPNSAFAQLIIKKRGPAKYRASYTVMRSDDPRVANINNHSRLDRGGFLP